MTDKIDTPKVQWKAIITAQQTTDFDGSTVVIADMEGDILQALSQDPEWAGAIGLTVTVKQE